MWYWSRCKSSVGSGRRFQRIRGCVPRTLSITIGVSGAQVESKVFIPSLVKPLVLCAILEETSSFDNEYMDAIFGTAFNSLERNPSCEVTTNFDELVGQVADVLLSV